MNRLSLLILFIVFIPVHSLSEEMPVVSSLYLDRPIWAVSLNEADWLLPNNKKDNLQFDFFSFSNKRTNMPEKPGTEKENDAGRTTRSLPLYLAERLQLESNCLAGTQILVVNKRGPVVSGARWNINSLLNLYENSTPRYFVNGHINQDFLDQRTKISISVWDTKNEKELFSLYETRLLSDIQDIATDIADQFLLEISKRSLCKFIPSQVYPRPDNKLMSPYLDALGQLLTQSLAQYEVISADVLWGEEKMLNWYLTLWEHFPTSDAPKLIYARGLLASISYDSPVKDSFIPGLKNYLTEKEGTSDVLNKLSPILYSKLGESTKCEKQLKKQLNIKEKSYISWLNKIKCN